MGKSNTYMLELLAGETDLMTFQDETLTWYAGYSEEEILPVVILMIDYMARPVIHEAFFKKYASKKFVKGMSSC